MDVSKRLLPGNLIEVTAYDSKPRQEMGEVYKVSWSENGKCWCYHVRLFVAENEPVRFRNFLESKLEAA